MTTNEEALEKFKKAKTPEDLTRFILEVRESALPQDSKDLWENRADNMITALRIFGSWQTSKTESNSKNKIAIKPKPTGTIKPIEPEYKGYRFRSMLEARWAVFFDACGATWEYEPEGFDLGDGLYYLPDFLLHNVYMLKGDYLIRKNLFVEVKSNLKEKDARKITKFSGWNGNDFTDLELDHKFNPTLVLSQIPKGENLHDLFRYACHKAYNTEDFVRPFFLTTVDGVWRSALIGVYKESFALADRYNILCLNEEKTVSAYNAARQARFEHGEKPHVKGVY